MYHRYAFEHMSNARSKRTGVTAADADDSLRGMEGADWTALSDQELLERRISKLGLRLEGTGLEPLVRQFQEELSAKALVF